MNLAGNSLASSQPWLNDLSVLAPLSYLAAGAMLVLLLSVAAGYRQPAPQQTGHLQLIALLSLGAAMGHLWNFSTPQAAFSGAVVSDGLAVSFGFTSLLGAFLTLLLSDSYLREHQLPQGEFCALLLLASLGMQILAMAGDLLVLFVGIEMMSLAVYVLAGYRRVQRRGQEAALKYFVYGAFASSFVIYGIALLYGEVGQRLGQPAVDFASLSRAFQPGFGSALGWLAVGCVLSGLLFKIAAVPFHMWAPDVYEGAPTPATAFMAVGTKAAAFAGLCRFVAAIFVGTGRGNETSLQLMEVLAILSMLGGNFLAVRQTNLKRMLAYSSIAHAGYLLVGVVGFLAKPQGPALEAMAYYLLGYAAMTLGAFAVVWCFERQSDRRLDLSIASLRGTGQQQPALALAMAVFMFALAGIPPTSGFFGKLSLFAAALAAGRLSVVLLAVLASAVGAYYYLRVLVVMYMQEAPLPGSATLQPLTSMRARLGLGLCVAITLGVGLWPTLYLNFVRQALHGWWG